ncbi:hypothetical protein MKW92_019624 [Papaver armeniacum]|nr:hypothetical protein MKW92_019624 [Papaver armeniacum]
MASLEIYRGSTIGKCLMETLDEMVSNGTLTLELAEEVLAQFDESMIEALRTQVKSKVTIKGDVQRYNSYADSDIWRFILKDAVLKTKEGQIAVGKVKIVACNSKLFPQ